MSNKNENNKELIDLIEECDSHFGLDTYILDFITENEFDDVILRNELDRILRILKYKELNNKTPDTHNNIKRESVLEKKLSNTIDNVISKKNLNLIAAAILYRFVSEKKDITKIIDKKTWKQIDFFLKDTMRRIKEDSIDVVESIIYWGTKTKDPSIHDDQDIEVIENDAENVDEAIQRLKKDETKMETYEIFKSTISKQFKKKQINLTN